MEIETICPNCKRIYTLDSQYEGSEAECESCHATFTVARKGAKSSDTNTYKVPPSHGISKENLRSSIERVARISPNYEGKESVRISINIYGALMLLTGIKILVSLVAFIKICEHVSAGYVWGFILELLWWISFLIFVFKETIK